MMKLKAKRLTKNFFFQPRMQSPHSCLPARPKHLLGCPPHPRPFLLLFLLICVFIQKANSWPSKDGKNAGDAVSFSIPRQPGSFPRLAPSYCHTHLRPQPGRSPRLAPSYCHAHLRPLETCFATSTPLLPHLAHLIRNMSSCSLYWRERRLQQASECRLT